MLFISLVYLEPTAGYRPPLHICTHNGTVLVSRPNFLKNDYKIPFLIILETSKISDTLESDNDEFV